MSSKINLQTCEYARKSSIFQDNQLIYLKDHRCVKVGKNLRNYEFELAGKGLVRVHAGYMVAMKYCAKIEKGQIVMEDGTEIPISRDRKNMVKEQFMISRRK